jgi:hypothetical protein
LDEDAPEAPFAPVAAEEAEAAAAAARALLSKKLAIYFLCSFNRPFPPIVRKEKKKI